MEYVLTTKLLSWGELNEVLEKSKRNEKKEERWSSMQLSQPVRASEPFNLGALNPSPSNALQKWKQEFREISACGVRV
jgi:hypothetical protein